MISNDTVHPKPRTAIDAERWLDVDFPGLEIACAEYAEGPTGCTVFHLPEVASMHIDVRGGSPGINGEHLQVINAICFAGGSLYGLEASTGVAAELFAKRGYWTKWMDIALVAGAIIFDYGRRPNSIYPDKELGRAALRAAREGSFPLGRRGAGDDRDSPASMKDVRSRNFQLAPDVPSEPRHSLTTLGSFCVIVSDRLRLTAARIDGRPCARSTAPLRATVGRSPSTLAASA